MIVKTDTINEPIAQILFGIASCPEKYQKRMIKRAIKYVMLNHNLSAVLASKYLLELFDKYDTIEARVIKNLLVNFEPHSFYQR